MKPAGYSGKPLVAKLGYQPGDTLYLLNAPSDFVTYITHEGIIITQNLPATWGHIFFHAKSELKSFQANVNLATIEKGFWVSWPKKSADVPTDLTEQAFRDLILPMGWVDTKVVAIDETWSGLKFLRRKQR